jgi:hypothetical protein
VFDVVVLVPLPLEVTFVFGERKTSVLPRLVRLLLVLRQYI